MSKAIEDSQPEKEIQYTAEFIEKAKRQFPDSIDLHNALDAGKFDAGNLIHRDIIAAVNALPDNPPKLEDMRAIGHIEHLWHRQVSKHIERNLTPL